MALFSQITQIFGHALGARIYRFGVKKVGMGYPPSKGDIAHPLQRDAMGGHRRPRWSLK
jgi:hypothetical protein